MKKILILLLLLQTQFAFSQAPEGILFFHGKFDEALAMAKKQNQLLFIDCYATWCGPCKWMAAKVFTNDTISNFFNTHFVSYKLDMEKGEGVDVRKKYAITNYPTFLWVDGEGKQYHRAVGAFKPEVFLKIAMNAINPFGNLLYLEEQYKAGSRAPEILLSYAQELKQAYDMSYQTVIDEYFKTQEGENLTNETNWQLVLEFTPNINSFIYNFIVSGPVPFYNTYGKDSVKKVLDELALESIYYAGQHKDSVMLQKAVNYLSDSKNKEIQTSAAAAELEYYMRSRNYDKYTSLASVYVPKYFWNEAHDLNEICWIYFRKVDDPVKLMAAEKWIAQSVKLEDKYYNTDTYAHLLNKLGKKQEAIEMAKHSIDLAKKADEDFSSTQDFLDELLKEK